MAAAVGNDTTKSVLDLAAAGMNEIFIKFSPCLVQCCLQGRNARVWLSASHDLKYGSHGNVHQMEVRAARGPHFLRPEQRKNFRAELLNEVRGVSRDTILHEDVGVVSLVILEPRNNVLLQYRLVLVPVDLDSHVHEEEGQLCAVIKDPCPHHDRRRVLGSKDGHPGLGDAGLILAQNVVCQAVVDWLDGENFLINPADWASHAISEKP